MFGGSILGLCWVMLIGWAKKRQPKEDNETLTADALMAQAAKMDATIKATV